MYKFTIPRLYAMFAVAATCIKSFFYPPISVKAKRVDRGPRSSRGIINISIEIIIRNNSSRKKILKK